MWRGNMEEKIVFEAEKVKLSSSFLKDFVVCTAYLMSDGINRNKSEFTLESLQNALPTFLNKPVLANIWYKRKGEGKEAYVGSHDWEVVKDENGEEYISYRNGEMPVGVINNESNISIQKYKGRNFVVAKLFLWKQYNYELIKILAKDKQKKVSVEVRYTDTETYTLNGEKIIRVNGFDFLGVTILGHRQSLLGEPKEIEEGIKDSHLELDKGQLEEYVMSYEKALAKSRDNAKNYDSFIEEFESSVSRPMASKRSIVLEELTNSKGEEVVLMALSSDESSNKVEGKYFSNGKVYSFRGIINIDDSCEIYQEEEINKERELSNFGKYLKIKQTEDNFDIKEVNLVDTQECDRGQLIYKIFTYHNFKDIVDYVFGAKDEEWKSNPIERLHKPLALIHQGSLTYSKEAIKSLNEDELKSLYQHIDTIPCFQLVTDMVKSIMEEKYEMGEASKVENEENKAVSEEVNKDEEIKENDCGTTEPIENGCDTSKETLEENAEDTNEPVDEEKPKENSEEPKPEEECKDFDDDVKDEPVDKDDDIDDDKDDDEPAEDFEQKYLSAVDQISNYVAQVETLSSEIAKLNTEKEEINKELEKVKEENAKLKDEAFEKLVEGELALSALDEENKNGIMARAKKHEFASLVDVQKEIAFIEKQTKTNSYTFGSKVEIKQTKSENVFDRLKKTW